MAKRKINAPERLGLTTGNCHVHQRDSLHLHLSRICADQAGKRIL